MPAFGAWLSACSDACNPPEDPDTVGPGSGATVGADAFFWAELVALGGDPPELVLVDEWWVVVLVVVGEPPEPLFVVVPLEEPPDPRLFDAVLFVDACFFFRAGVFVEVVEV